MTNFQTLVKESNKTLAEISHDTGISYSTLGNYNQGTRTPKIENAKILAEYFGVSIAYIMGIEEENTSDSEIQSQFLEHLLNFPHLETSLPLIISTATTQQRQILLADPKIDMLHNLIMREKALQQELLEVIQKVEKLLDQHSSEITTVILKTLVNNDN